MYLESIESLSVIRKPTTPHIISTLISTVGNKERKMFNVACNDYLRQHNVKHYESGFKPQTKKIDELRKCAFSPTVYRKPTKDELYKIFNKIALKKELRDEKEVEKDIRRRMLRHTGGYRAYKFVIGLLDSGYVDIDDSDPQCFGALPTISNVHNAMTKEGYYNIVFQSASAKPNKLRLIYKRDFMLYLPGTYSTSTNTWELQAPTSKQVQTTNPEAIDLSILPANNIVKVIESVSYAETMFIKKILHNYGINTSGIDETACRPHMHSAPCIVPNREYQEPQYDTGLGVLK